MAKFQIEIFRTVSIEYIHTTMLFNQVKITVHCKKIKHVEQKKIPHKSF